MNVKYNAAVGVQTHSDVSVHLGALMFVAHVSEWERANANDRTLANVNDLTLAKANASS